MVKRKASTAGKKKATKRVRTKSVSKDTSLRHNFVVGDYNARVDYVAKKKKYNKSMKKFQDKVMKVLYKRDQKILKVKTLGSTNTAITNVNEQAWQIFHMRPYNGVAATPGAGSLYNEQAQDDISDILSELVASGQNEKIKILRSEMEISIRPTQNGIIEVYELVYLKKQPSSIGDIASFNAALTDAISNLSVLGSALDLNRRGITPFDITSLIKDYGVKVIKKTVFNVVAVQGLNYRMTDYSHDTIDKTQMDDVGAQFCIPGTTRSALVIYKAVATESTGSITTLVNKRYQVQLVRINNLADQGGRD